MWRVSKSGALGLLALAACGAASACDEGRPPSLVFKPGAGGTGTAGAPTVGGSLVLPTGGSVALSPCTQVPPTPLTRYSVLDLDGTLDDLFGQGTMLASTVTIGDRRYWRDLSVDFVDALRTVARERAQNVVADSDTFEICETNDDGASCVQRWLSDWGEKLYRRPLTPEQLEAYVAQFRSALQGLTPAEAARNALVSMILSPYFVLRIELGSAAGQLDAYEVAARLSRFATRRSPDPELLQSAASGALLEPAERLAQLRRLSQLPTGRAARVQQLLDWLELGEWAIPRELAPELRAEMLEQSKLLIADVFETQGATLSALLTTTRQPLTPSLAEHYGLPAPQGSGFSFVEAEPSLAGGLLAQGLFLSAYPRPTLRGLAIFRGILCGSVPDHPATVVAELADGATPRERITQSIGGRAECRACHDMIDPLGFALEAFDDQGRETGFESHGAVRATSVGLTFEADDPAALGRGIAASAAAATCATRHYLEYALDRDLTPTINYGNPSGGPPPIVLERAQPEVEWVNCLLQQAPAQPFNLEATMERLVQSAVFTTHSSGVVRVVAFDTSVDPLDHAAQEASLFIGAFFDQQDNEKMRSYVNALTELKRLDALGPDAGGAGGAAGAGGSAEAGQPQGGYG
ncbi:MAG TPA: DUF1592 domain-containing protein [Polyangiaceae bacterium]|nr:DUF1592 domain-containing protein [Polyangiaceae bacterium]